LTAEQNQAAQQLIDDGFLTADDLPIDVIAMADIDGTLVLTTEDDGDKNIKFESSYPAFAAPRSIEEIEKFQKQLRSCHAQILDPWSDDAKALRDSLRLSGISLVMLAGFNRICEQSFEAIKGYRDKYATL
jgi:hypothetical protein